MTKGERAAMRGNALQGKLWGGLAAGAMSLILAGCVGLGGAKPPAMLFNLQPDEATPAGATVSGKAADVVQVLEPETDRRLSVQRVPVQIDDARVAYLQGVLWVERPARLFMHLLAETLRARGGRLVLEEGQNVGTPGTRLSGQLVEMGYDVRSKSVIVRFDALRTTADGQVTTRRFEAVVPDISSDPKRIGPALSRAANDVAKQVADWVAS